MLTRNEKTNILLGIFVAALIAANLLGNKITVILGISVSVGIFSYPITFLITDIVEEVHGKKKVKSFLWAGFVALLFVIALTALSIYLPPASRFLLNEEYVKIFSLSLRITIASIIAFLVSQAHDIWSFNFWKVKTKGKFLWLRNNLSTMVSQFIDTMLFMFLAFYYAAPQYDALFVFTIALPYYVLKVLMAVFDTPFCYLGVRWLRK